MLVTMENFWSLVEFIWNDPSEKCSKIERQSEAHCLTFVGAEVARLLRIGRDSTHAIVHQFLACDVRQSVQL